MSSSDRRRPAVLRATVLADEPCVLPAPREPAVVRREAEAARVRDAVDESYRRGVADGDAAVREELGARAATLFEWLEAARTDIAGAKRDFLAGVEDQVVGLALALAEKMVAREVRGDPDAVKGMLREVLAGIADHTEITVRVAPESIEALRVVSQELGQVVSAPAGIRWVPDRRVSPWGLIVETEAGKIDASVEAQLTEAATLFKEISRGRDA